MKATTINLYNLQESKERQILNFLKDSFEVMIKQGWDSIKTISEFLLKYEMDTSMKSICINFDNQIENHEEVKEREVIFAPEEIYSYEHKLNSFSFVSNKKLKDMEQSIHSLYSHALTLESAYEDKMKDFKEQTIKYEQLTEAIDQLIDSMNLTLKDDIIKFISFFRLKPSKDLVEKFMESKNAKKILNLINFHELAQKIDITKEKFDNMQKNIENNSLPSSFYSKIRKVKNKVIYNENGEKSLYIGEYIKRTNIREGFGTIIENCGYLYQGYWKDNKKHYYGRAIFDEGDMYEGEFKHGEYYGFGTFTWKTGETYQGYYKSSKPHGYGIYINAHGESKSGIFEKGTFVNEQNQE